MAQEWLSCEVLGRGFSWCFSPDGSCDYSHWRWDGAWRIGRLTHTVDLCWLWAGILSVSWHGLLLWAPGVSPDSEAGFPRVTDTRENRKKVRQMLSFPQYPLGYTGGLIHSERGYTRAWILESENPWGHLWGWLPHSSNYCPFRSLAPWQKEKTVAFSIPNSIHGWLVEGRIGLIPGPLNQLKRMQQVIKSPQPSVVFG